MARMYTVGKAFDASDLEEAIEDLEDRVDDLEDD
jgi:chaperonin cofactor prefoldin